MTDLEVANALAKLNYIETPVLRVRNHIVRVDAHAVVVKSERTGYARTIPFADLRAASRVTRNGVIVRVLAEAVGL